MAKNEHKMQIENLKKQIAELPEGYISKKTINGNVYYYHQWNQDGKKKSKYLRSEEVDILRAQIITRRELQKQFV